MRVDWTPTATDDLERLWLFMAERNIDHADRIERRINEAAAKLGRFPQFGRKTSVPQERDFSLVDLQYILRFRIDDDRITILRVFHTRQDRIV